jgi:hypothetical protein
MVLPPPALEGQSEHMPPCPPETMAQQSACAGEFSATAKGCARKTSATISKSEQKRAGILRNRLNLSPSEVKPLISHVLSWRENPAPQSGASFQGRDGCPQPSHLVSSDGALCWQLASFSPFQGTRECAFSLPLPEKEPTDHPPAREALAKRLSHTIALLRTKPNGTAEDSRPYLGTMPPATA